MEEKRYITIDNGGSELRYISNTDNSKAIYSIDKNLSIIDENTFRIKDGVEPFDIVNVISAPSSEFMGVYAKGAGYYMYSGVDVALNNQRMKSGTTAWYQQLVVAIAEDAIRHIRDDAKYSSDEFDGNVVFDYNIFVLIPVSEHSGDADNVSIIKSKLSGMYRVMFPCINSGINDVTLNIKPENIGILPEGVISITNIKNISSTKDYTLILDVGHVSTDIALCKGAKLIGSSVLSSQYAGGTLIKLAESILRKFRVILDTEQIIEVLNTYKLHIGNKTISVSDEIRDAKSRFVINYLKSEILNQIELAGISATNIMHIVPLGGVLSMVDPETRTKDVMDLIIRECGFEDADVITFTDCDPRCVNITEAAKFVDKVMERRCMNESSSGVE